MRTKKKSRALDAKAEALTLSGRDAANFWDALLNPPPPNAKLIAAARRYKTMLASGELTVESLVIEITEDKLPRRNRFGRA
jgi:Protein of unknown function (DUF1778)